MMVTNEVVEWIVSQIDQDLGKDEMFILGSIVEDSPTKEDALAEFKAFLADPDGLEEVGAPG